MPIAPPSTPLAQGIGAYPSETATDTSLNRSLAARTCSVKDLRWLSDAMAVPTTNNGKKARLLTQLLIEQTTLILRSLIRSAVMQLRDLAWRAVERLCRERDLRLRSA